MTNARSKNDGTPALGAGEPLAACDVTSSSADRRQFLHTAGRFALVVPPAMTLLLSTSMTSSAIAASGGEPGDPDPDPGTGTGGGGGGGGGTEGTGGTGGNPGVVGERSLPTSDFRPGPNGAPGVDYTPGAAGTGSPGLTDVPDPLQAVAGEGADPVRLVAPQSRVLGSGMPPRPTFHDKILSAGERG